VVSPRLVNIYLRCAGLSSGRCRLPTGHTGLLFGHGGPKKLRRIGSLKELELRVVHRLPLCARHLGSRKGGPPSTGRRNLLAAPPMSTHKGPGCAISSGHGVFSGNPGLSSTPRPRGLRCFVSVPGASRFSD